MLPVNYAVRTTDGAKQSKKLREKSRGCTAEVLMTEGYIYAFTKKHIIHAESIGCGADLVNDGLWCVSCLLMCVFLCVECVMLTKNGHKQ